MADNSTRVEIKVDAQTGKAQDAFTKLGSAAGKAEKEVKLADRALLDIGGRKFTVSDVATGFNAMATAARGALGIVTMVAGAIKDMADRADEIGDVFGNLEIDIAPAREATRGLTNDLELARLANMATSTGVAKNAEEFARLAKAADAAAVRLGKDTAPMLMQVTEALASGRTTALKRLGVMLDQATAERKYALQLGVTVDALSETERAEALRKIGLQELEKATEGVNRGTSGAAFVVKQAATTMENLANRAMGASADFTDLNGAIMELEKKGLVPSIKSLKTHGSSVMELRAELRALGVDTEKTRSNIELWIHDIVNAKRAVDDLKDSIMHGLLVQSEELNKTVLRTFTEERTHEIDKQIIALNGVAGVEEHINDLLHEKNQLLINEARLAGDAGRARSLERQEELRQLQLQNKKGGGRRSGGKQLTGLDAMIGKGAEKRFGELESMLTRSRKAQEELNELLAIQRDMVDPFSEENLAIQEEAHRAHVARTLEIERALTDELFMQRMMAIEEAEAAGVDPLARIRMEENARAAFLKAELERAEAAKDVAQQIALSSQIEKTHHDARMARLAVERGEVEATRKKWQDFTTSASELHLGFAEAVARATIMNGESFKEALAGIARTQAMEFGLIQGPSELIRAAIAAASFNVPKAAVHLSNAGIAFAHAAAMGAIAGAAGGFSAPSRPSIPSMSSFGGGPGSAGTGASGGSEVEAGGVPVSVDRSSEAQVGGTARAHRAGTGGVVINVNHTGAPDAGTTEMFRKAFKAAEQNEGAL